MQYVRQPVEVAQAALFKELFEPLQAGKKVLWLVPGGSNIPTAVHVMDQLSGYEQNLYITLTDERYGLPGHADSNWQQLLDAGFSPGSATICPVLQENMTLEESAMAYATFLAEALSSCDKAVGQLGMGADGHISGILPHSPATTATTLTHGYHTEQYDRITTTFNALRQLNVIFCLAYGADKRLPLKTLASQTLPLAEQPAQLLKEFEHAYVYNDQIGDR